MTNKKISAYTYVRNANEMNYPFIESISSYIQAGIDEVVVVDASDKEDGTTDMILDLADKYPDIVQAYKAEIDWTVPNFGIWDGQTKAIARSHCTGKYLIQFDVDECLEDTPNVLAKINNLITNLTPENPILAFPVVEYWGSNGKVRCDVNPWKERISLNVPEIIHGIPIQFRKNVNGLLYSQPGSDGCNMINKTSGLPYSCLNFITKESDETRRLAQTNEQARIMYELWFNTMVKHLPTIYHFSWWSVEEKIKKYRFFFNNFWHSLYHDEKRKNSDWNPFFPGKKLEEVSDQEIVEYAKRIEKECGGHVFHEAWNGQKTNHVMIHEHFPKIMENWCSKHKTKSII